MFLGWIFLQGGNKHKDVDKKKKKKADWRCLADSTLFFSLTLWNCLKVILRAEKKKRVFGYVYTCLL
jgi:hypothetical protein